MNAERFMLSPQQALSMLPDGDTIHTYRSAPSIMLGADWSRAEIVKAIEGNECEIGGRMCQQMNHGLVIHTGGPLFVECKEAFDYDALEKEIKASIASTGE